MEIQYDTTTFNKLNTEVLYQILQLRSEVFVVEQNCLFQDLDNKDQASYHITLNVDRKLAAYSRLLPAGLSYPEPSIGRVVTVPEFRSKGLGKALIAYSIQACYKYFGPSDIRISAQVQLISFYKNFGFKIHGSIYLEDGIKHIEMIKHYDSELGPHKMYK